MRRDFEEKLRAFSQAQTQFEADKRRALEELRAIHRQEVDDLLNKHQNQSASSTEDQEKLAELHRQEVGWDWQRMEGRCVWRVQGKGMKAFLKWVYSKLIDVIIAVLETLKINFELIDLSCSGNKKVVLDHCCMSSLFLFTFFPFVLDSPLNRKVDYHQKVVNQKKSGAFFPTIYLLFED